MAGAQRHLELVRVVIAATDEASDLGEQLAASSRYRFDVDKHVGLDSALRALADRGSDGLVLEVHVLDESALRKVQRARQEQPALAIVVAADFIEVGPAFEVIRAGAQDVVSREDVDRKIFDRAVRHAIERQAQLQALNRVDKQYVNLAEAMGPLPKHLDSMEAILRDLRDHGAAGGTAHSGLQLVAGHLREIRVVVDKFTGRRRRASARLKTISDKSPSTPQPARRSGPAQVWFRRSADVPAEGDLSHYRLAEVLHWTIQTSKTGELIVEDLQGHPRTLYIQRGTPVAVSSSVRSESFGAFLERAGYVSAQQREEAYQAGKSRGMRMGEALLTTGVLSPHQLYDALRTHIRDSVVAVFGWEGGVYRFIEKDRLDDSIDAVETHPVRLILDGLRRHFDPSKLPADFPAERSTTGAPLDEPAYRVQELALKPKERRVFNGLVGGRSLTRIVNDTGMGGSEVMGAAYGFYVLQAIALTDARPTELATPDGATPTHDAAAIAAQAEQQAPLRHHIAAHERHEQLIRADYFELLGLTPESSDDEVRNAYNEANKRFSLRGLVDAEEIRRRKELLARIRSAYHVLCTSDGRKDYARSLSQRTPTGSHAIATPSGAGHFEIGKRLLNGQKFERAAAAFAKALEHEPDNPSFLAWHGWAQFQVDPRVNRKQALNALHRSMDADPDYPMPHVFLGRIAMEGGDDKVALHHFDKALILEPDLAEAQRYVELLQTRGSGKATRSGGERETTETPRLFAGFARRD